jgi:hypothetical protein
MFHYQCFSRFPQVGWCPVAAELRDSSQNVVICRKRRVLSQTAAYRRECRFTAGAPWVLIGLSFIKVFGMDELNLLFI